MPTEITFKEMVQKLRQQENTVTQLVRIIAATNHRIAELEVRQEEMMDVSSK